MEQRLTRGGLYKIEPIGFLNILRINLMAMDIKGWRNWELLDVIPKFTPGEWSEFQRLATVDEIQKIRRSYREWNTFLPDYNNGRTSPTLYYDYFQQILRAKTKNGPVNHNDHEEPYRFQPISDTQTHSMPHNQRPENTLFPQDSAILVVGSQGEKSSENQSSNTRIPTVRFN